MTETGTPALRQVGGPERVLSAADVDDFVAASLADADLDGASVCVIVPDATRTAPLPALLRTVHRALAGRVSRLTVLVALGTHAAMSEPALARWLGYDDRGLDATYPGMAVIQHEWWDPASFATVGEITAARIAELSGGRLDHRADVSVNRAVVDHDVALVVGPVFPHEVVGFSGGNKYFVPGVAGEEIIDLSHWLGALITSAAIIGTPGTTPVRALIDAAAAMIPVRRLALCAVTTAGSVAVTASQPDTAVASHDGSPGLHALAFGSPEDAWTAAAAVSAQTHVRYLDAPVRRVVSVMPARYADMWTAAKGFYKVEPVVADGGEVIIYAPAVTEISAMHPEIETIGYHVRDYFVAQWERFRDAHWSVLAHSTHLRGAGTYDPVHGERARVTVTLATGIPPEVVRGANLEARDPRTVDLATYADDPQTLVVPDAGEVLYRLR